MGCDSLVIKDMAGIISPRRAKRSLRALRQLALIYHWSYTPTAAVV